VPPAIERSTYVLLASLVLILLFWQWRPIPTPIWTVTDPRIVLLLQVIFWLGWFVLLLSTFLLNHFELFGLRQVFGKARPSEILPTPEFSHAALLSLCAASAVSGLSDFLLGDAGDERGSPVVLRRNLRIHPGRIWFEERDLIAVFGDRYRCYREQVGMLLPLRSGRARTR